MIFNSVEDEIRFSNDINNNTYKVKYDHEAIALSKGLILHARDSVAKNNAWYELKCGHVKSINRADVKRDKFSCKECTTVVKYVNKCKDINLTYIDKFMQGKQTMIRCKCNKCDSILEKKSFFCYVS